MRLIWSIPAKRGETMRSPEVAAARRGSRMADVPSRLVEELHRLRLERS